MTHAISAFHCKQKKIVCKDRLHLSLVGHILQNTLCT